MDHNRLFPRLLPGVHFSWEQDHLYLGYRHRGIEIELIRAEAISQNSELTPPILAATLDMSRGEFSLSEIFRTVAPPGSENELTALFTRLESSGYLTFDNLSTRSKTLRTVSELSHAGRALPELNLARSAHSISDRRERSILIFGENRLAHHLTILLRASGFGLVKRIDRREVDRRDNPAISPQITPQEIIGLSFRQSDIGRDRAALIAELESGINIHEQHAPGKDQAQQGFPSTPSLIITTHETQPDYRYRWMNEGIPHLLISSLADHQIEIGPIVLPGQSPCGRCIEMAESAINPIYRKWRMKEMHATGVELSSATVSAIGGLVVLELISFFNGNSTLIGRSKRFDLHNAMSPVDLYWAPHPECGCTQLN